MTSYLIVGSTVLVIVLLLIFLRNKAVMPNSKLSFSRILSYVFLFILLAIVIIAPEQKILVYIMLAASIVTFGISQYQRMKQFGGNAMMWFLPIIFAMLIAILFIVIRVVEQQ